MNKFIAKLVMFMLCIAGIDVALGLYLNRLPELEIDRRLEYVLEGAFDADIIIIGSSVGARGVLAEQICTQTPYEAYNLSYPGSDIRFHEFILTNYLKYNIAPEKVILTVDETIFKSSHSLKFRLDRCYPLLKYSDIKAVVAKHEHKNTVLAKYSNMYMANRALLSYTKKKYTALDTILDRGSMPLTFQNKPINGSLKEGKPYDKTGELQEKINAFKTIISLANNNNIDLVLCLPPQYKRISTSFVERLKTIYQGKYILADGKDIRFHDKNMFSDKSHLNKKGAELFTDVIINTLKL
ncbi:MAG: hypothetical protein ACPGUH_09490 [Winogradskyella sp.]